MTCVSPVLPRIRWLAAASSDAWLALALAQPELVLLDHAHCERKAAGVALQLMFRYPGDEPLAMALSALAREELEHFERVLKLMQRRSVRLRQLQAPRYGSELAKAVRRQEPLRQLDSFLVAGLIEARSHERMTLLAAHSKDCELRALYADLLASEARHFGLYWVLAETRFSRAVTMERLQQLAAIEHDCLLADKNSPQQVRMHSPGVKEIDHGTPGLW